MEEIDEKLLDILKILAPGTVFRNGLENILRAQTGGLIVVSDKKEILDLVNDGFQIDSPLSPARLYELAKMDGAIVLDQDAKNILFANAQLIPDPTVKSSETGTRHKTAERVARQTGELVIAISQRRSIITIYKSDSKHILEDIRVVLVKANQAIQTLEKYRSVFDQALTNLGALEFEDLVTLSDVVTVIQRTEMVLKIQREIEKYISELGSEGRLIKMQLEELVNNVKKEGILLIEDYISEELEEDTSDPEEVLENLTDWSSDEILTLNTISKALGYSGSVNALEETVSPRGYRIMRKIPRLPMPVIENLVEHFENLQAIIRASVDDLDDVDGIGEVRAQAIKDGLRRLRDQVLLDRHI